ncbi:DUF4148 domain-containing protein [Ideonella sp.]|uniref:DUF4148 domain-containing protein n=1 Tax=Ideonella sp. TaxID=1929293 RepID=UPI0035B46FE6
MFAKQAQIAVAALAFAVAGSAFAADAQRNVFDTETNLRAPAAETKLTREQVRAEFLAARANGEVNVFDNETVAYVKPVVRADQTRLAQAKAK